MSATGKGELHLLRTKLYRPRPTRDLVERPRLREILDRYRDRTVTLVCAPAGFGKTTLVADWLAHTGCPSAWLSLDESDRDLRSFLAYLVAAVQTAFPSACAETYRLLAAPDLPPAAALVTALANDLDLLAGEPAEPSPDAPSTGRFVVVLDDYHLVAEPAVHSFLGELLRHPPRGLHLVVCTRHDPPFIGHALRARGDFSEIRSAELRFTAGEAAALMQRLLPTQPSAETLAALVGGTEGWGAGLRLSALALEAGGEVPDPELIAENRYTFDYLMAEVLSRVPAATVDFLLQTSILERLAGPLCDAVAGPSGAEWDGRAYLEWLASQNVFTFAMDGQGLWYRYHHQFRELLRRELERRMKREEIAGLHARAAGWFAQNGLPAEALEHARAAGGAPVVAQPAPVMRGAVQDPRGLNRAAATKLDDPAPPRPAFPPPLFAPPASVPPAVIAQMPVPPASPRRPSFAALVPGHWNDARLADPLSEREMDVLLLMSQRLSHKEIAQALIISPQTVKRHAANIYQKLAVNGRRDAVATAAALGLLPPAGAHSQPSRYAYSY